VVPCSSRSIPQCLLSTFPLIANLPILILSTPSNESTTTKASKMLHYEQQPAVGYPTFPGNVEALSLPAYSPERHASQDSVSSTTTMTTMVSPPPLSSISSTSSTSSTLTSNQSNQSPKAKRRQTLAACRPCRKRKSKVRPFHTACTIAVLHSSRCQRRPLV